MCTCDQAYIRMSCSVVEYYMLSYFHYNYIIYHYIPTIKLSSNTFIYYNVNYELMCIDACIPLEDWRCDQYHWSNQGVRWLPRKDPRVKKSYFHVDTPNGPSREFVKHAYVCLWCIALHWTTSSPSANMWHSAV